MKGKLKQQPLPPPTTAPHRPRRERLDKQTRARVFARDGGVCQLCREPVRFGQLWTADHIKPSSHGGTGLLSNLRLAHKRCNEARGNRAARTDTGGYVR